MDIGRLGAAIALIASSIVGVTSAAADAAVPTLPIPVPSPQSALGAYQIRRVGSFEVAPLYFQGVRLFEVAAPALQDPNAFPPVAARIDLIADNFNEVVPPPAIVADIFKPAPTRYDPATFHVKTQLSNGYWSLYATDDSGAQPTNLLTVTELDAKYNGISQQALANSWADILQAVLSPALQQRAPGALEGQISTSVLVILAAVVLTALIIGIRIALTRIRSRLVETPAPEGVPSDEHMPAKASPIQQFVLIALGLIDWILAWSIGIVWAVAVLWALYQLGPTQALARKLTSQLVKIFLIWFIASVAARVAYLA
ncbi:MAG: hypothetical protein JO347_02505, partial [Candidatus Eremiobacteraeota bacterium]|nr:hypothetical protein [Candidatus Eremiobacteraeota bacterium]